MILYILLSGQPPFWGVSERAIFHSILVRSLPSPSPCPFYLCGHLADVALCPAPWPLSLAVPRAS